MKKAQIIIYSIILSPKSSTTGDERKKDGLSKSNKSLKCRHPAQVSQSMVNAGYDSPNPRTSVESALHCGLVRMCTQHNLTFVETVPPSALYVPNFISEDEERDIIKRVKDSPQPKWTQLSHRRLQNWGGIPHPKGMIAEQIPSWLQTYMDKIGSLNVFESTKLPNHVLINEYLPGQGIMGHSDGPLFHPVVTTISCGSHTLLEFYKRLQTDDEHMKVTEPEFSFLLEPRSLLVLRESLYHDYLHSIAERDSDTVIREKIRNLHLCAGNYKEGDVLKRTTRLSLTVRHVPKTSRLRIKLGH